MPSILSARGIAAAAGLFAGLVIHCATAFAADPNVLWNIVHGQCVPDERQHGNPKPCAEVNLKRGAAGGYAVLKDIKGTSQFLLIPTRRVTGIESPLVRSAGATNYFAEAWRARGLAEKALGRVMPRDTLSLAVNSIVGRSQNQLHIHIDCIRADIRWALQSERSRIGRHWTALNIWLAGHRYSAMRVDGTSLAGYNPFKLLARDVPGAKDDMGHHTLVVVGMWFDGHVPGFVILDDHADPAYGDEASGEELQDHACELAAWAYLD
jgi:CDP-diacylglycerol pyrophosphatase